MFIEYYGEYYPISQVEKIIKISPAREPDIKGQVIMNERFDFEHNGYKVKKAIPLTENELKSLLEELNVFKVKKKDGTQFEFI